MRSCCWQARCRQWNADRDARPRSDTETMADEAELPTLEWWPDYGGDLFWSRSGEGGRRVTMDEVGLSASFQQQVEPWLESYDDSKLPMDGSGDADWLASGARLLAAARAELAGRYVVMVTEPYWSEPDHL